MELSYHGSEICKASDFRDAAGGDTSSTFWRDETIDKENNQGRRILATAQKPVEKMAKNQGVLTVSS